MKIAIVTDDNAGFPLEEAKRLGLFVVPMPIVIDGKDRFENRNISYSEFFKLQASGSEIHTSQPLPKDVLGIWDEALKEADEVVYVPMSSGLSEATQTALMLAESDPKYNGKVFVVDNHRISVTLRQSIYDALYLREHGKSGKEIKNYLEKTAHDSKIYIVVDTLKYLVKGGRVTPAGAALGSAFHIKPILKIEGGKLDAKAKVIGIKKASQNIIKYIQEDVSTLFKGEKDNLAFAIAYTKDLEKAKEFRKEFASALKIPEDEIMLNPLSLSVATHIGPGALAATVSSVLDKQAIFDAIKREENN